MNFGRLSGRGTRDLGPQATPLTDRPTDRPPHTREMVLGTKAYFVKRGPELGAAFKYTNFFLDL